MLSHGSTPFVGGKLLASVVAWSAVTMLWPVPALPQPQIAASAAPAASPAAPSEAGWIRERMPGAHLTSVLAQDGEGAGTLFGLNLYDRGYGFGFSAVQVTRSINAGATWEVVDGDLRAGIGSDHRIRAMALPDPATLLAAFCARNGGDPAMRVSYDGGHAWSIVPSPAACLVVLYAGTDLAGSLLAVDEERGLWTAPGPGSAWQRHGTLPAQGAVNVLPGSSPRLLFIDQSQEHLFASDDLGQSWSDIKPGPGFSVQGAVAFKDGRTILVCSPSEGILSRSEDRGATWSVVATQQVCGEFVAEPARSSSFALLHNESLATFFDRGGASRTLRTLPFVVARMLAVPGPSGTRYLAFPAAAGEPLRISDDHGVTWSAVAQGPTAWAMGELSEGADGTVLAAPDLLRGSSQALIWRQGEGWSVAPPELDFALSAVLSPTEPGLGVALVYGDTGILRTTDGGRTWEASGADVIPDGHGLWFGAIWPHPSEGRRFFSTVGTFDANSDEYSTFLVSEDGGLSWRVPTGLGGKAVGDVAFDPVDGLLGLASVSGDDGIFSLPHLYGTADGGLTWAVLPAGSGHRFGPVAVGGRHFYALDLSSGMLRSDDAGSTWRVVGPRLPFSERLRVDPADPLHVLALSSGPGLIETRDGWKSWRIDPTFGYALGAGDALFLASHPGALVVSSYEYGLRSRGWHTESCAGSTGQLCLGDRFTVEALWRVHAGRGGWGRATPLTRDTGFFWFFDAANLEIITKTLDGCAAFDRLWFFAAGLTDVATTLTVRDTWSGATRSYTNSGGTAFAPVLDTGAFRTCDAPGPATASTSSGSRIAPAPPRSTPAAGCDGPQSLCLRNGRFRVEARWRTVSGASGSGIPTSVTADTGFFWFFTPNNVEVVVKVLDGCALNGHFWVFSSGLTDVEVTLMVTDTKTGVAHEYRNPAGTPYRPIQDTQAFATCSD